MLVSVKVGSGLFIIGCRRASRGLITRLSKALEKLFNIRVQLVAPRIAVAGRRCLNLLVSIAGHHWIMTDRTHGVRIPRGLAVDLSNEGLKFSNHGIGLRHANSRGLQNTNQTDLAPLYSRGDIV